MTDSDSMMLSEIKNELKAVSSRTYANAENIAKLTAKYESLKTTNDMFPLLLKWVIFPLVIILAGSVGAEKIFSLFIPGLK